MRQPDLPVAAPAQHAFDGRVNQWCSYRGPLGAKCGKPANDPVHRIAWKVSSPSDLPVAAPDHAATLNEQATRLSGICSLRPFTPSEAEEAVNVLLAIPALLAERQQDKERIERLEAALREIASQASDRPDIDVCDDIEDYARAALAVEEDAHG